MNKLTIDDLKRNMKKAKDTTPKYHSWCALNNIVGGAGVHCDCCRMLIGRVKDYEDEVPYGICGVHLGLGVLR